jgi:paraquat-inducible protein A
VTDSARLAFIACHDCDELHHLLPIEPGAKASCRRCGSFLYRHIPDTVERGLALYLASLILFVLANAFPFLSLQLGGRIEHNILFSSGWAMYEMGMGELGLLIFFTSIAFPLITILGMLYLLVPLRFGHQAPASGPIVRLVTALAPWSLVSVFMLGVLIGIVKLQDLATVIPGVSLFALVAFILVYAAARANFDPQTLWAHSPHRLTPLDTGERILNCHTCGMLSAERSTHQDCPRCTAPLHHRKQNSIHRSWALVATATILIVPANIYPVMTVIRFGKGEPNTIMSGIVHLLEGGMWGLGMIIFVASIVVPVSKLMALCYLLVSVQKKSLWRRRDRTVLFRITEVIGAWSMVDIFLVGLLSALVALDALTTIRAGIGATYFGAVVVITMLAAHSFDPRLIWDTATEQGN